MSDAYPAGTPDTANGAPGAIEQPQPQPPQPQLARGRIVSQTCRVFEKNGEQRRVTYFSLDTDPGRTYAAFGFTSFDENELPTGTEVEIVYVDWPSQDKWGRPVTYHNLSSRPRTVEMPAAPAEGYPELDAAFGPAPTPVARKLDKANEIELACSCLRKAKRHLDSLLAGVVRITGRDADYVQAWIDSVDLALDDLRAIPSR